MDNLGGRLSQNLQPYYFSVSSRFVSPLPSPMDVLKDRMYRVGLIRLSSSFDLIPPNFLEASYMLIAQYTSRFVSHSLSPRE